MQQRLAECPSHVMAAHVDLSCGPAMTAGLPLCHVPREWPLPFGGANHLVKLLAMISEGVLQTTGCRWTHC